MIQAKIFFNKIDTFHMDYYFFLALLFHDVYGIRICSFESPASPSTEVQLFALL